ncbi:DNA alkylation repair protein [Saccharomonospora piscinae]|uniref:DNA alkylation repair protein n=1 Tax=Saccharomonospora piscinae TaxID=687388 RepID=UPI0009DDB157
MHPPAISIKLAPGTLLFAQVFDSIESPRPTQFPEQVTLVSNSGISPPGPDALVHAARDGLARLADPQRAPRMREYMKSELPFRGVPTPQRRQLARRVVADHPLPDRASWRRAVLTLWDHAAYREERSLAIDITGHRAHARWQTAESLPLYEHLVVTGAWWDFVDEIAINRLGPILRGDPGTVAPVVRRWAHGHDLWRRRAAVLSQNASGPRTDTALLAECLDATAGDPDFFLRKAVGWALRQYSRSNPEWVRNYVSEHPELAPLSRREALRHLS